MAADLPPIVTSDLFDIQVNTAMEWAVLAQDSWADYLAARRATEERGRTSVDRHQSAECLGY